MVVSCCVNGCKERFKKGSGITFHQFPEDENQRDKWIDALRSKRFIFKPWKKLCSKHFQADDYEKHFGRVTLMKTAVPTVFPKSLKMGEPVSIKRPQNDHDYCRSGTIETQTEASMGDLPFTSSIINIIVPPVKAPMEDLSFTPLIRNIEAPIEARKENLPFTTSTICTPKIESSIEARMEGLPSTSSATTTKSPDKSPTSHNVPKKRRQEVFVGDFQYSDMHNPTKAIKLLDIAKKTISKHRTTVKSLRNQNSRLQKRVKSLTELISHLRDTHNIKMRLWDCSCTKRWRSLSQTKIS